MAEDTGSLRKDIDAWFLDARKRLGWNEMRRKHFNNKRADIVDAAKRFFLNTDPSRPLPHMVESEFASMQIRAQELYSNKFEESPLAVQLDRSIIDMTPGIKARVGGTKSRKTRTSSATKAARNYPTPQPSPTGASSPLDLSPTPSLLELPLGPSKRRASLLSEFDDEYERPSKRQR